MARPVLTQEDMRHVQEARKLLRVSGYTRVEKYLAGEGRAAAYPDEMQNMAANYGAMYGISCATLEFVLEVLARHCDEPVIPPVPAARGAK